MRHDRKSNSPSSSVHTTPTKDGPEPPIEVAVNGLFNRSLGSPFAPRRTLLRTPPGDHLKGLEIDESISSTADEEVVSDDEVVVTNLEEPPSLPEKSNPLSFSEERRKSEALILTESPKLMRRMLSSPKISPRRLSCKTPPPMDTTIIPYISPFAPTKVLPRSPPAAERSISPFDPPPQRVVKSPPIFSRSQSLSIDLEQTAFSREESGPPHSARRLYSREDRPIV
ncbi:hypothetical protein PROFUN_14229 [Planoprotostelium fungivorum]|uniref:Uncharacterized protein n=1 Tax=Planoprotostelium fungivorum TaxID=1890364 RepID=A0A2P6N0R8_9EUKA|nr:hypothetical protein PROFUN_14229 [Planoprotostelium fungivorum]